MKRCATSYRGSMTSAGTRSKASTATAPALPMSRQVCANAWRSGSARRDQPNAGFRGSFALAGLVLLALAGFGGLRWWQHERAWQAEQQLQEARQRIWDGYVA